MKYLSIFQLFILLILAFLVLSCTNPMVSPSVESLADVLVVKYDNKNIQNQDNLFIGSVELGKKIEAGFLIEYHGRNNFEGENQLYSMVVKGEENYFISVKPLATLKSGSSVNFYIDFQPRQLGELTGSVKLFVSSDPSNEFIITLEGLAVDAPPILSGRINMSQRSSAMGLLSWMDTPNESGYRLYISEEYNKPDDYILLDKDQTSYLIGGMEEDTFYRFWVTAFNQLGPSGDISLNFRNTRTGRWTDEVELFDITMGRINMSPMINKIDLKNDHLSDLIIGYPDFLGIYHNVGNHQYELHSSDFQNSWISYGVMVFDYENDGDEDFFHISTTGTTTYIDFYRNVSGNFKAYDFENMVGIEETGGWLTMTSSDLNNDGYEDILVTRNDAVIGDSYSSYAYLSDGLFRFFEKNQNPGLAGLVNGQIKSADLDNDSDNDVLVSGENENGEASLLLFENDGQGGLSLIQSAQLGAAHFIELKDIDNDGLIDVVSGHAEGSVRVFHNNGALDFSEVISSTDFPVNIGQLALEDLDNDGDNDLVVLGGTGINKGIFLYRNRGKGDFVPYKSFALRTGEDVDSFMLIDSDGDGDQDIIIGTKYHDWIDSWRYNYGNFSLVENLCID